MFHVEFIIPVSGGITFLPGTHSASIIYYLWVFKMNMTKGMMIVQLQPWHKEEKKNPSTALYIILGFSLSENITSHSILFRFHHLSEGKYLLNFIQNVLKFVQVVTK